MPLCLLCDPKAAGAARNLRFFLDLLLTLQLSSLVCALCGVAAAVSFSSLQGCSSCHSDSEEMAHGRKMLLKPLALLLPRAQQFIFAISLLIFSCLKSARLELRAVCCALPSR